MEERNPDLKGTDAGSKITPSLLSAASLTHGNICRKGKYSVIRWTSGEKKASL